MIKIPGKYTEAWIMMLWIYGNKTILVRNFINFYIDLILMGKMKTLKYIFQQWTNTKLLTKSTTKNKSEDGIALILEVILS